MPRWRRRSGRSILTNFLRSWLSRSSMDSLPTSTGSRVRLLEHNGGARLPAMLAWLTAALWIGAVTAAGPKLLEPERAFAFSVQAVDDKTVEARFPIATGYYLYREKLRFSVEPATLAAAPRLP